MTSGVGDISVVIPTFNRSPVLDRALDSVIAQTHSPAEVIVVDDGSTDGTAERVESGFPGVRVLQQENLGVSAARNRGIGASRGDWVAFLDSDDEWRPDKLERQVDALGDLPELRICHTDEIWIRRGRRVNPRQIHAKQGGWIFEHCLPLCAMSPSSILIHRSVLDDVGLFDETLPACEDYDLWLRICSRYPVLYVDEPLVVKYGGHEDQLSRRIWGLDRFRIRALEKVILDGSLSEHDRNAAATILVEKIGIYLAGARKRSKAAEVAEYEAKRLEWAEKLATWKGGRA